MSDEQAAPEVADLGEIPGTVVATEVPAAKDARDKLLRAIGQEAQYVVEKSAGQASTALEELARAFALVTDGQSIVTTDRRASGGIVLTGGAAEKLPDGPLGGKIEARLQPATVYGYAVAPHEAPVEP